MVHSFTSYRLLVNFPTCNLGRPETKGKETYPLGGDITVDMTVDITVYSNGLPETPFARTVQRRRDEVSDTNCGEEVAAAEFKVPEPKTRGQKRKSQEAEEHHDQWWLRGGVEADDEPSETHTGDSLAAMPPPDASHRTRIQKRGWAHLHINQMFKWTTSAGRRHSK